jgi:hypothetical protein
MAIVVRFSPTSLTREQYDQASQKMEAAGDWPPQGLQMHVLFGDEGDLRVSEIWDSREHFEAFGEKLRPALADAGIQFSGEPEVFEVQELVLAER